jgi:hypothetical protein
MKKTGKSKLKFNTRTVYTFSSPIFRGQSGDETTITTTFTGLIMAQKQ